MDASIVGLTSHSFPICYGCIYLLLVQENFRKEPIMRIQRINNNFTIVWMGKFAFGISYNDVIVVYEFASSWCYVSNDLTKTSAQHKGKMVKLLNPTNVSEVNSAEMRQIVASIEKKLEV